MFFLLITKAPMKTYQDLLECRIVEASIMSQIMDVGNDIRYLPVNWHVRNRYLFLEHEKNLFIGGLVFLI